MRDVQNNGDTATIYSCERTLQLLTLQNTCISWEATEQITCSSNQTMNKQCMQKQTKRRIVLILLIVLYEHEKI